MKVFLYLMAAVALAVGNNAKAENLNEYQDEEAVGVEDMEDVDDYGKLRKVKRTAYSGGDVSVSEDGALSVESAMRPESGSMRDYWTVFRFRDSNNAPCIVEMAHGPYMDNVHVIHKDNGITYYIIRCHGTTYAWHAGYEELCAYRIVGDNLERVSVMDGGKKLTGDEAFEIAYNIPDWSDATAGAGFDWLFEYDTKTRSLYVPKFYEVEDAIFETYNLTDRYDVWHFDGLRFVKTGEKPHKNLHPSLARYAKLLKYYKTKGFIVRVDALENGKLRYAAWKRPKTMADAPNLVIAGGSRGQSEYGPTDEFTFTKGQYKYVVNHIEPVSGKDGETYKSYLLVLLNGKVILRQEEIAAH